MIELKTGEQFKDFIQQEKVIMIFSADWCPDCRVLDPLLPSIEEQFNENTFVYVDRDKFIDICIEYDIFGIPSFIGFNKGQEVGRFVSKDRKTEQEITNFIEKLFV